MSLEKIGETPPAGQQRILARLLLVLPLLLAGCASTGPSVSAPSPCQLLATGIYDAENLAFGPDGRLFVSAADRLYAIRPGDPGYGRERDYRLIDLEATFVGTAMGPDGRLYVGYYDGLETGILRVDVRRDPATYAVYLRGPILSPNGLRFDDDGTLYVADFGLYLPGKGTLWRVDPDPDDPASPRRVVPLVEGLSGPNGVAIDRNRGRLYFTETFTGKVWFLERAGDRGFAPHPRLLVEVDNPGPTPAILDDLALGDDGRLYVCHYNGNRILVLSPEGRVTDVLAPPGLLHPTALAFGVMPADRHDLYVTQKGHMLVRERKSGDRLTRIPAVGPPYRLPFLDTGSSRRPSVRPERGGGYGKEDT